jgi:glycerophosphoryl diester phosphodiesterase
LPNSKILLIIEKDPECPTYLEDSIKFCSKASLDGLVMDCESAELLLNTPDLMPLKKDLKFYVYGDDVSKKEPAKRFLDNGIDGIITDDIDAVISLN